MSELYDRIISQRGEGLKALVDKIPGFKGYHDREARRDADRMLRDYLAEQLEGQINRFAQVERTLLDGGSGLAYMSKSSSAKTKVQILHDKIKTAAPKYAGFFAVIKIESEELEKIYNFDQAMVQYVTKVKEAIGDLESALGDEKAKIETAIATIGDVASEGSQAFELRDEVLTNLDKELGS
jgi:hypothetical protein